MPELEVTLLNANNCCLPASRDRSCQFEQQGFVHGKNRKTQEGRVHEEDVMVEYNPNFRH